jgi:3-deoxy-manno-octulosonate cytidylyltransferase (CMP-KDO synthetase)
LYVYKRTFLLEFARLRKRRSSSPKAWSSSALEHGFRIVTVETTADTIGVDTPEDLERVRRLVQAGTRS